MADQKTIFKDKNIVYFTPKGGVQTGVYVQSTYTKDGNILRGAEDGESATFNVYVRVNKTQYDALDKDVQFISPYTSGFPPTTVDFYYKKILEFGEDGKFTTTSAASDDLRQDVANYNNNNPDNGVKNLTFAANKQITTEEGITIGSINNKLLLGNRNATVTQQEVAEARGNPISVSINIPDTNTGIERDYGNMVYPLNMAGTQQDRMVFSMRRNQGKNISTELNAPKRFTEKQSNDLDIIMGSVQLPIQGRISDDNSVDWQGATLNAVEAYGLGVSLRLMQSQTPEKFIENTGNILQDVASQLGSLDKGYADALKIYLAQQASGARNVLSRASGAILNPNLELLFNAPSLRPFTFTYRLSARGDAEATQIRRIIRFFKQGMSVKSASTGVFLKSPNIFDINYITYDKNNRAEKNHQSINKIKTCALTRCAVDYAPDGTYMTYEDEKRTMTSYNLTMTFNEIDPVYEDDYRDLPLDEIGY